MTLGARFLGRSRTAPAYAVALDQTTRARLRDPIRSRIPLQEGWLIRSAARAWAVRAWSWWQRLQEIRKSTIEVLFEQPSRSHPRTFLPLIAHDWSRRP